MDGLKPVPGFPGYYASLDGHVWSTWKMGCKPEVDAAPFRKVKPYVHNGGYHQICLRRDGVRFKVYVHEIVLLTFKGACPEGKDRCRHLNGNPADNRPENLEWGTAYENAVDTVQHGRSQCAKLSPEQVQDIRKRYVKGSGITDRGNARELAAEFGINVVHLREICRGKGSWRWVK